MELYSDVQAELSKYLHVKNPVTRNRARRGYLAIEHGGTCKDCMRVVPDFWDMGKNAMPPYKRFEFDHIFPLEFYEESPRTALKQFRISGNDCVRRRWNLVYLHCLEDTQLLCRECHFQRNTNRRSIMKILWRRYAPSDPLKPIEEPDPDDLPRPPPSGQRTPTNPMGRTAEDIILVATVDVESPDPILSCARRYMRECSIIERQFILLEESVQSTARAQSESVRVYYSEHNRIAHELRVDIDFEEVEAALRNSGSRYGPWIADTLQAVREGGPLPDFESDNYPVSATGTSTSF